jgi:hypothetical protein
MELATIIIKSEAVCVPRFEDCHVAIRMIIAIWFLESIAAQPPW